MGDLAADTAVKQVDDCRYQRQLSSDWEIWGPMGGYVASVALRAVGEVSGSLRPASFSCQYLGVAAFDTVDVTVTALRAGRTAAAYRAEMTQGSSRVLEAIVWCVGDVDGLAHDVTEPPSVPDPDDLNTMAELLADAGQQAQGVEYAFWRNLDGKPLDFDVRWPPPEGRPPVWRQWCRFTPTASFPDPWVDACRSLILVDLQSWPSASRPHAGQTGFYAPSLDLYVAFHDPQPDSEWLLCDGHAPIAAGGVMGWTGRLWSRRGRLVASGAGQLLCRRWPQPPAST